MALILFLQWPLRDFVRAGSREANDLGQWIFALYVSPAMTFASREHTHLAVDAVAHGYNARLRSAIARWGGFRLPGAVGRFHDLDGGSHGAALGAPVEKVDDETARKRFNDMLKLPPPED